MVEHKSALVPDRADLVGDGLRLFVSRQFHTVAKAHTVGELMEGRRALPAPHQRKLLVERARQACCSRRIGGQVTGLRQHVRGFAKAAMESQRQTVVEGHRELLEAAVNRQASGTEQNRERSHDGQPGRPPRQRRRLPSPPLLPGFNKASIGNAVERQVAQVAAQIAGQLRRGGVPIARPGCQALLDDVGKPNTDMRVPLRPSLCRLAFARSDQRLAQQNPERVDVGAPIDRLRNSFSSANGFHRCAVLGSHPSRRPPQPVRDVLAPADGPPGQVEVQKHRQPVTGDQNVRRLHIQMHQLMGMRSFAIRQPGTPRSSRPPRHTTLVRDSADTARRCCKNSVV